jgi:hypothetical protein
MILVTSDQGDAFGERNYPPGGVAVSYKRLAHIRVAPVYGLCGRDLTSEPDDWIVSQLGDQLDIVPQSAF